MAQRESDLEAFFQRWFSHLYHIRRELRSVRYSLEDQQRVRSVLDQSVAYYELYYRVRAEISQLDPIRAFVTPWVTSVERGIAFWLAGWRPNTLIHLLYTESSRQLELQLEDILNGVGTGCIGDLSPAQLRLVDELQRKTIRAEDELELEMSRLHEELATQFVESGLPLAPDSDYSASSFAGFSNAASRIKEIIARADNLRMTTLREVLDVLYRPVQAIDLLLAAADFEIGIRNFGLKHDTGGA